MLQGYLLRSTPSIEHVWCISCLKFIYSARLAGIGNSFYQANALCMLLKSLSTAYCEHILSDHLSFYLCFQSRECFVSFALLFYIRRTSIYEFIISSFLDKTKLSKSYLVLHVVNVKKMISFGVWYSISFLSGDVSCFDVPHECIHCSLHFQRSSWCCKCQVKDNSYLSNIETLLIWPYMQKCTDSCCT